MSDDDKTAYVTNEGFNNIAVVDLANKKVLNSIPAGEEPTNILIQQNS